MHDEIPWSELRHAGESLLRPGLARRVLAEAAQRREAAQETLRMMVVAGAALSLLILGGIEVDARVEAPVRLAQWNQVADWVGNFDR